MGTPPLQKNGHDQTQDRDIRELKDQFHSVRVANDKDHGLIKDVLSDLKLSVAMTNERINSNRTVAIVVWALFLVVLGGVGWVVNQAASVLSDVAKQVGTIDSRQQSDAAKGWEMGESFEQGIKHNHEDIRELRKLHRLGPKKE